jgi:hypothetical protein
LRSHPLDLLRSATTSATARASSVAANLHVHAAGFEVGVDIRPHVGRLREDEGVAGLSPVTHLELGWEASRTPALFPSMRLELSAWPISSSETQIEIAGSYQPPLGVVGYVVDTAVGHRIAEASVHCFLSEIIAELHRSLPATGGV